VNQLRVETVPASLESLVSYQDAAIVSRILVKTAGGSLTLFAFDAGQSLSEHTVPHQAFVVILEGTALISVGGQRQEVRAGESIPLPANVPHAVDAPGRFKMFLAILNT
jgi:quercetin dioxygenase-like cupin family protein